MEYSISELSRMLGLGRDTVKKYIEKSGIQYVRKNNKGAFYSATDVLWFKPMIEDKLTDEVHGDYDLEVERARETKERADNLEIKNSQLRGELVPVDALKWLVGKICANINSGLESLPLKMKRRVAKLNATDINLMKSDIAKVQSDLADMSVSFDEYEG